MKRRDFLNHLAGLTLVGAAAPASKALAQEPGTRPRTLRLWAIGDAHVGTDMKRKRESLADAIRQSEKGGSEGGRAAR